MEEVRKSELIKMRKESLIELILKWNKTSGKEHIKVEDLQNKSQYGVLTPNPNML